MSQMFRVKPSWRRQIRPCVSAQRINDLRGQHNSQEQALYSPDSIMARRVGEEAEARSSWISPPP